MVCSPPPPNDFMLTGLHCTVILIDLDSFSLTGIDKAVAMLINNNSIIYAA